MRSKEEWVTQIITDSTGTSWDETVADIQRDALESAAKVVYDLSERAARIREDCTNEDDRFMLRCRSDAFAQAYTRIRELLPADQRKGTT